jgi:hypothetical protein
MKVHVNAGYKFSLWVLCCFGGWYMPHGFLFFAWISEDGLLPFDWTREHIYTIHISLKVPLSNWSIAYHMPVTFGMFSYSTDSSLLWPGANPFTAFCILSASVYFVSHVSWPPPAPLRTSNPPVTNPLPPVASAVAPVRPPRRRSDLNGRGRGGRFPPSGRGHAVSAKCRVSVDQTFEALWTVPWSIDSAENAPTSWAENNPELAPNPRRHKAVVPF